jgi:hypothetical protein
MPAVAGVEIASVAAGIRYKAREDMTVFRLSPGTYRRGGVHPEQVPRRAGGLVPRGAEGRQGARTRGECRQQQRLHRPRRAGDLRAHRRRDAALIGCKPREVFIASTGVIGERLPTETLLAALPGAVDRLTGNAWGAAARAIMTTDTFRKGATRTARIGEADRHPLRHRQGQRHGGARHGDHAVLHRHRREDPGPGAAEAAEPRQRALLQLRHRGQRHLDLGHGAALRHRPGEAPARVRRRAARPAAGLSPARWTRCCTTSP